MTDMDTTTSHPRADERLAIISADCHAGAPMHGYRDYLESKWWDEFDAWASDFENPFADLDEVYADRNWDSAKRLKHLEDDGIVAEVIFPNTVPPFYPSTALVAPPAGRDDYERRWAGLQAHNRWLVDFCADTPGRRAGIAQLMFNDPDAAIDEIVWAKENGLDGGVLLPSIPPGSPIPAMYDPSYERVWAAIEDHDVVINHHGGSGTPDYGPGQGLPRLLYLTEFTFFSNRNLWHLVWAGVFERHPRLKYAITEQGVGGLLDQAKGYDGVFAMLKGAGDTTAAQGAREMVGDYADTLNLSPSGYIRQNCWIGASFMSAADASRRDELGVDRFMWGCDYPHTEATWPESRRSIAEACVGIPVDEVQQMLSTNAAELYGFDLDALAPVVERIGPTVAEIIDPAVLG